jgi:hypothetical protein
MSISRRNFLKNSASVASSIGLSGLIPGLADAAEQAKWTGVINKPHVMPRAKRVIWMYMAGAPSQVDLFDYKPDLVKYGGEPMPESLTKGQQLAQLQGSKLIVRPSNFDYKHYGESGLHMSTLLPHIGNNLADKITMIRSMHTEQINHDTAHAFMNTGSIVAGRPSFGAWVDYALGGAADDLPPFVVMVSKENYGGPQPLSARQWTSGFLPSRFQGIEFQSGGTPVHYLDNPGTSRDQQGYMIDQLRALNEIGGERSMDPELVTRNLQYAMAYKMQESLPALADIESEPDYIKDMYGIGKGNDKFARNCLLARKMVEGGSRFIQLYHRGWDNHHDIDINLPKVCQTTDQASAALVMDLEQRGLLEDTLVIWGGEFGRTAMAQGTGRDHHIKSYTMWLAGGGIKQGFTYGKTDDFSYNIAENGVHVHDLQATIMHLMGIDHKRLTYRYQGRDFRLTDVGGNLVSNIIA